MLDAVRDQACVDPQGPYPTQCDIYTEPVRSVDGLAAYRFGGAKPDDWRRAVHWSLWHCAELHGLPDEVTVSERTAGGMWRAWNPGPDAWTSCVETETPHPWRPANIGAFIRDPIHSLR